MQSLTGSHNDFQYSQQNLQQERFVKNDIIVCSNRALPFE